MKRCCVYDTPSKPRLVSLVIFDNHTHQKSFLKFLGQMAKIAVSDCAARTYLSHEFVPDLSRRDRTKAPPRDGEAMKGTLAIRL